MFSEIARIFAVLKAIILCHIHEAKTVTKNNNIFQNIFVKGIDKRKNFCYNRQAMYMARWSSG